MGEKKAQVAPRVYGEDLALAVALAVAPALAPALGRVGLVLRGALAERVASPGTLRSSVLSTVLWPPPRSAGGGAGASEGR
jgi:hypothetical protein